MSFFAVASALPAPLQGVVPHKIFQLRWLEADEGDPLEARHHGNQQRAIRQKG